jgi:DNA-dependent protein kinase catalytic subunit
MQFRILRLLGKLGGSNHRVVGDVDLTSGNIAWDVVERLRFSFPFQDMKPEVFLDSFLPVVVELAETSRERQSKVAACELLHSLVLYMVGSSASIRSREMQFYQIYQRIFPSLIRLACDVELVARQLFEPLVFQLIHWFTKNAQYENEETMNLLDAIVEAVGNHSNGGLRDFAAKCLSEFLKWSLKHSTQQVCTPQEFCHSLTHTQ